MRPAGDPARAKRLGTILIVIGLLLFAIGLCLWCAL
jgi:hypothetical protein